MNAKLEIIDGCLASPEPAETITCPLCGRNYQGWRRYTDHVDHHRSMGKTRRTTDAGLATSATACG